MIDVIIVEDNETIRQGLAMLIDGTDGYRCIGNYSCCEMMLEKISDNVPDVLLMDIGLPGMSGIEGIREVKKIIPDLNIIVLTIYEDNEKILNALCVGATGYLVKKTAPSRLLEAIKDTCHGGSPMSSHIARKVVHFLQQRNSHSFESDIVLTDREREILSGLAEGKTYQGIANTFFISVDTVRFHIRNIYRKMQVHSVSEAIVKAIRKGLL